MQHLRLRPGRPAQAAANAALAAANFLNAKLAEHLHHDNDTSQALESAAVFSNDAHTTAVHTLGHRTVTTAPAAPEDMARHISPVAAQCAALYLDTLNTTQLQNLAADCGIQEAAELRPDHLRSALFNHATAFRPSR